MTSATSPRRTDHHPAGAGTVDPRILRSRAKIVDAATALLVESGPRAVTVDAVSDRSGVSKSTMYRHFASREELLVEVMRCNVPDIDPPGAELGFDDALRQMVGALADALACPEWRRIMPAMISLQQTMPDLAELSAEDRHEKFEILRGVLERGAAEGILPDDLSPELVAHVLFGPIVFAIISNHDDVDAVVDYSIDRFLASYRG